MEDQIQIINETEVERQFFEGENDLIFNFCLEIHLVLEIVDKLEEKEVSKRVH